MVYQPDNAYTKKYGYQFGQFITNPTQHLAGSNVFTQYSYTKKENKKYSIQHLHYMEYHLIFELNY